MCESEFRRTTTAEHVRESLWIWFVHRCSSALLTRRTRPGCVKQLCTASRLLSSVTTTRRVSSAGGDISAIFVCPPSSRCFVVESCFGLEIMEGSQVHRWSPDGLQGFTPTNQCKPSSRGEELISDNTCWGVWLLLEAKRISKLLLKALTGM